MELLSNFNPLNFIAGNLTRNEFLISLFVPFSQLYFRIVTLDGSLDKPWLLFPAFLILPLSIVPTLFVNWEWIQKGQGGKPYDNWMYIPIILHVLLMLILKTKPTLEIIIKITGITASIMIPYFIRESNNCKTMGFTQYANILGNSALVMGIAEIIPILFTTFTFLPVVGTFFSILDFIKLIPIVGKTLYWSIGYLLSYIILNMFNGTNINNYCSNNNLLLFGNIGIGLGILGFVLKTGRFGFNLSSYDDDEYDDDEDDEDYDEEYEE